MSAPESTSQAMLADRMAGNFAALEISGEAFTAAYDTPDIGPHIEKDYKGLSYLSWPFAYRYLKQHFPTFYVAFEEKTLGEVVFGTPGCLLHPPIPYRRVSPDCGVGVPDHGSETQCHQGA